MPIISIIVPVYKVELYIRQCLDSVLAQNFTDYECILVDDGSPDDCPAICDEYAAKDKRIKVIHKENGGLSDARNAGIRSAIGDYIVLLDSDDLLADNEALGNFCGVIERTKVSVVFNSNLVTFNNVAVDYVPYDGINENIDTIPSFSFYKELARSHKILLAGWLFSLKRSFLLQHNLFFKYGILHEDEHWMPRVICAAERIAVNHSLFYAYRKERENSITSQITPRHIFDKFVIIEDLLVLSRNEKISENHTIYKNRCVNLWFSIFYSISVIEKNYKEEYKEINGRLKKFSYLLLYRKTIKYILLFLLLSSFGIKFCQYVLKHYGQIKLFLIRSK
jgi:glycosyltransferase involved in cell wall biosynthesis